MDNLILASPQALQPSYRLVVLENALPTGQTIPLPSPPYNGALLIGRNDLQQGVVVDIDLSRYGGYEKKTSRKHAKITCTGNQFFVEDWESTHGTYVNKERMAAGLQKPLADGDEVRFAELVAQFKAS
ncbi:MAG: FHA domain-containing protein [Armatimonadetes bacterium]|nr:FHA domain-containing protein [Armatimonadota bacterium]